MEVVHSITLSANPLYANGINSTAIKNSLGEIIGVWDGKDGGGRVVFPGTYFIQVKTTDKNGNDFLINVPMDVITKNSYSVSLKAFYQAGGSVEIFGDAVNVDWITLKIYNIAGELIGAYPQAINGAKFDFTWGRDNSGKKVSNGIYICVAEFKDQNTGLIARKNIKLAVKY